MTRGGINRRHFLGGATTGTVAFHAFPYHLFANGVKKAATDRIQLGPRKIELSRLAMGSGTDGVGGSSNQTRKLGVQGLADLFRAGYDQGVTFWDSADQYGTHPNVKLALKGLPREKVTILSKTHASTEKEMRADLDRFRRELGTDYIDILLLHCMTDRDWPDRKKGAMAVISEAQEKGIVRTHGASCHTLEALKTAAATPWVEVDLARIISAPARAEADGCRSADRDRGASSNESGGQGRDRNEDSGGGRAAQSCRRVPAICPGARLRGLLYHRRRKPGGDGRPGAQDSSRERSRLIRNFKET